MPVDVGRDPEFGTLYFRSSSKNVRFSWNFEVQWDRFSVLGRIYPGCRLYLIRWTALYTRPEKLHPWKSHNRFYNVHRSWFWKYPQRVDPDILPEKEWQRHLCTSLRIVAFTTVTITSLVLDVSRNFVLNTIIHDTTRIWCIRWMCCLFCVETPARIFDDDENQPHVSEKWLGSKIDAGKTMTTSQIMPTIRTTIVQVCANVLVVGSMQVGGVNYLWILLLILCKKQIVNTIYTQFQ